MINTIPESSLYAIHLNLLVILILLGSVQGILLSLTIGFSRRHNFSSRILLAVFIAIFSLMNLEDFLFESHLILQCPYLVDTFSNLLFALPPTFFLYTQSLVLPRFRIRAIHLLHYIPIMLMLVLMSFAFYELRQDKLEQIVNYYQSEEYYFNALVVIPIIQALVYLVFVIRLVSRHSTNLKEYFSEIEKYRLRWIFYLIIGYSLITGLWILSYSLHYKQGLIVIDVLFMVIVYASGYLGYFQKEIPWHGIDIPTPLNISDVVTEPEKIKYRKSGLAGSDRDAYFHRLMELLITEQLYTDPEISLKLLSEKLAISPNHLSQVINEKSGKNFYDFINGYRVEKVKCDLVDPMKQRFTILSIGFDAGFNSKAAFYNAFRKSTGLSPSAFRDKELKD